MKKLYPVLFACCFVIQLYEAKSQVLSQDSLALVDLYDSTNGANWTTQTNWLTGNVSTWYGITVSSNRVTQISMNNNNISGIVPSSFGDLTALTYLKLSNNKVTSLPETLSDITTITSIRVDDNLLTDFPYFIGKMTQLTTLWIDGNNFNVAFPDTLYNLVNIQSFNISNCGLSGSLDSRIANWPNLTHMYFDSNKLSGEIPAEIGEFPNLRFLQLYNNELEGEIPLSIGKLISLNYLRLYNNQLSGSIPDTLFSISSLIEINLYENNFSGTISSDIGNLSNLTKLYLYNNDSLKGAFPSSITNATSLQEIKIQNNQFEDFPDISGLTNIKYLYLENNKFTFEDLEPNTTVASSSFSYSPQDSVYDNASLNLNQGDTLTLISTIGGSANQYQWYKNGSAISGATDDTLQINNVTSSYTGSYTCKVTNTLVSGLSIYRKTISVNVNAITSYLENSSENSSWIVFPNPSTSGVYTFQNSSFEKISLLKIMDINGQLISSHLLTFSVFKLDLSMLAKGIYTARIENSNYIQTIKIVQ